MGRSDSAPYILEKRERHRPHIISEMTGYIHYYILFQNHTDAMAMYRSLKGKGLYAQISPTPRELSVCCGVSLLVRGEDVEQIEKIAEKEKLSYIEISGLNNTFDNTRHKYG